MAGDGERADPVDWLLEIAGTVQGVGFRPFAARLAARHGLRGWVRNDPRGVAIRITGPVAEVEAFVRELAAEAPANARIRRCARRPAAALAEADPVGDGFAILASSRLGPPETGVSPDLALCPDCRRELLDPRNRRHRYPFINCTQCGPRYSIVRELPYDRVQTTMSAFPLCAECEREFHDPADRRFHAQPLACPVCGPHVEWQDRTGRVLAQRDEAIAAAGAALRDGLIVAVKGLGGFHLLVDATNERAVAELRRRKHREEKPLAVMFPSIESLETMAHVEPDERRWLTSPVAPIVLVRRRPAAPLAGSIAPGNPWVGALLPYTPLHLLLLQEAGRPVVATSGNVSEEPLCTHDADARERLGKIADGFLTHDRPIARAVDDSVLRIVAGEPVMLRRARGFAPSPLALPDGTAAGATLCVGAHLKSTVAIIVGGSVVLSPHIGDLGEARTAAAHRATAGLLGSLYRGVPGRVGCDAHPDYASTRFAESLGIPVLRVQHHLAHILACLLEHGGGPNRVLGVAWDGTGHGPDGTIWGGEFIVVDRAALRARRVAQLRAFRLAGGETAVREPRRSALGLLHALHPDDSAGWQTEAEAQGFTHSDARILLTLLQRATHAPLTTSAGRLFDGVAALLGLRRTCSFEGQAAMELECAADAAGTGEPWPIPLTETSAGSWELDWGPMVETLLAARGRASPADLAGRFHASLAVSIAAVARRVGIETVVLTGGCFQNARLLTLTDAALRVAGFRVLRHRELPPGDGAIAAGQALAVHWGLTQVEPRPEWFAKPASSSPCGPNLSGQA